MTTINEQNQNSAASGSAGTETQPPPPQQQASIIRSSSLQQVASNFIGGDWAITKAGLVEVMENYRQLPQILGSIGVNNPFQAVEAYRSECLESTYSVKVRNGVAIIPIVGPIFRNFNWYVYYYGGTSVSLLARDINAALDNPNVHAILFEIHSPGGEVTGVNELAKMIFAARKRKPMTARIGGYGCSAAYWLASQMGDIVLDETAQVGSIGVQTVYLDDSKFLAEYGFEEIVITSDVSPYKNIPPTNDEGLARVKKRINAIAKVFTQAVADGMGVKLNTVLKDFGQGDVLVGQDAIDAGMADRLGSFEETLDLLAKAHNPNYVPSASSASAAAGEENLLAGETGASPALIAAASTAFSSTAKKKKEMGEEEEDDEIDPAEMGADDENEDEEANAQTLNSDSSVTSSTVAENSAPVAGKTPETISYSNGEFMSQEKNAQNQPAAGAGDAAGTAAVTEQSLAARENVLNQREQELAQREQAAETARLQTAKDARRIELAKIADDGEFTGKREDKVNFMEALADKFGQDSAEFKAYVEDQKATAAQIKAGGLFEEIGANDAGASGGNGSSAEAKLDKLAKERASKDGISYEKAYSLVLEENPALYQAYEAEQQAAR